MGPFTSGAKMRIILFALLALAVGAFIFISIHSAPKDNNLPPPAPAVELQKNLPPDLSELKFRRYCLVPGYYKEITVLEYYLARPVLNPYLAGEEENTRLRVIRDRRSKKQFGQLQFKYYYAWDDLGVKNFYNDGGGWKEVTLDELTEEYDANFFKPEETEAIQKSNCSEYI